MSLTGVLEQELLVEKPAKYSWQVKPEKVFLWIWWFFLIDVVVSLMVFCGFFLLILLFSLINFVVLK